MSDNAPAPLIRWAGSKKRSLADLLAFSPPRYTKYVEAFAGSACLFFALDCKKNVINDSNKDLISFYKTARRSPDEVFDRFFSLERNKETYYDIRKNICFSASSVERAAYFYYLNRNCFNGIYRTNSAGHFNVPFSSVRVPPYPSREAFKGACAYLRRSVLECGDFEDVCLRHLEPGAFVYLDPPYYVPAKRIFREYSAKPFNEEDFRRLKYLLVRIQKSGAYFMLSYPDCDLSRGLAASWNFATVKVRRSISGSVSFRGSVNELVIYNYKI